MHMANFRLTYEDNTSSKYVQSAENASYQSSPVVSIIKGKNGLVAMGQYTLKLDFFLQNKGNELQKQ